MFGNGRGALRPDLPGGGAKPEKGFLLAAVGLIGKVLGPVGLIALIVKGRWPPATIILCATNDFIWWIPFGLYLWDSQGYYRKELFENKTG